MSGFVWFKGYQRHMPNIKMDNQELFHQLAAVG